jgi:hypothetical protein
MPFDPWMDSLAVVTALVLIGVLLAIGGLMAWCG